MKITNLRNYIFLFNLTALLGLVWLFLNSPRYFIYILLVLIVGFSIEAHFLLKGSPVNDNWWNLAIFPSLAATALIAALTVLSRDNFFQFTIFVIAWLISTYWKKAYLFFHEPKRYKLGSLEYLADYGNIFVVFLVSISYYGFRDYLNTSFWLLAPGLAVTLALVFYNFFWSNKLPFKLFWPYLTAGVLILGELAWTISLLPFTFINTAILLTVCYYSITHLQKLHLQAKITSEKIRHYLAFITLTFIIIFLSARWL